MTTFDKIMNFNEARALVKKEGFEGFVQKLEDEFGYGFFSCSTYWYDANDTKYICKLKGKYGDIIIGWDRINGIYNRKGKFNHGYEIGKSYFNNYWRQYYQVLDIVEAENDWHVVVKWDDGRINSHCTIRSEKDLEVSNEEFLAKCSNC